MARAPAFSRAVGGLLLTIALGSAASALAQAADSTSAVNADTAAPAEPRRRGRDRQREETPAPPAASARLASSGAEAADVAEAAETVEAKLICKSIKSTGTRVARRVCGTPEQWASVNERTSDEAQETMRQIRDRTSIVVSQPDNPLSPGRN